MSEPSGKLCNSFRIDSKQINYCVKGTEKFWSEAGVEALLALRADYVSDEDVLEGFWQRRQAAAPGQRPYRRSA